MNYEEDRYICPSCGSNVIVCEKKNRFAIDGAGNKLRETKKLYNKYRIKFFRF